MAQKVCKFTKRKSKSYLVSAAGISDSYAIHKSAMFPDEWVILWVAGDGPPTHDGYAHTLPEAKKIVAERLGCRLPERKGRKR